MRRFSFVLAICLLPLPSALSQSAIVRDANGTLVGAYIGVSYTGSATGEGWAVLTPMGYAVVLDEVTGSFGTAPYAGHTNRPLNNIRYTLPDCQGVARVTVETGAPNPPIVGGFAFRVHGATWYSPKGAVSSLNSFASSIDDLGACSNGGGAQNTVLVVPNDPATTGVPTTGYVGPLMLGYLPSELFASSFESLG